MSSSLTDMRVSNTFDRSKHQPYRINPQGFNKEVTMRDIATKSALKNTLAPISGESEAVKLPSHWTRGGNTNPNRSLTELEEKRKLNRRADPSYDLDGDGIVGSRDMLISKLFDKDKDGKLNEVERKNAEEAIRNVRFTLILTNIKSFYLPLLRQGIDDMIQNRHSGDFQKVSRYPEHPISKIVPKHRTKEELASKRRDSNRRKIETITKSFDENYQLHHSLERKNVKNEFQNTAHKPRFTSINEKREFERQETRKKANLTNVIHDQKDEIKAPSLAFIHKPSITSMTDLQ